MNKIKIKIKRKFCKKLTNTPERLKIKNENNNVLKAKF